MNTNNDKFTPNAKKIVAILFTLFFILYLKYKPYDGLIDMHGVVKTIFYLYFFVINQTIGIIHEAGHGVCYIFHCPQFITALNGTIFQWAVPLLIALYYKKRDNKVAYSIALFILAISMDYTAWYISTANEGLFLPASKSFLGVDGYHDFNYILTSLGLLNHYKAISILVKIGSIVLMFYAYFKLILNTVLSGK